MIICKHNDSLTLVLIDSSIKLLTPETKKRAIAHFYRPCTIFPYIEPNVVFASRGRATEARTSQGLGWSLKGDKGQVEVTLKLPRPHWVAGQSVWLDVEVDNRSTRQIKTMTLALLKTVKLLSPNERKNKGSSRTDVTSYTPHVTRQKLFEQTTEASTRPGPGHVGTTGWWTGVHAGECLRWQSSLILPVSHQLTRTMQRQVLMLTISYVF